MKKFLLYLFLILFISSNYSFAKWGKGTLKMDDSTLEHFLAYIYGGGDENFSESKNKRSTPMVFTVAEDGGMFHYYYCPYAGGCTVDSAIQYKSELKCMEYSNGSTCYTFAIGKRIVWKNGNKKIKIKKKDMKSPYVIAKKIQEAGFYDGDISNLRGINMKTGRIDGSIKITGEDNKKIVEKDSNSSSDIVKELSDLKLLLDSEAITKEEFEKAKKKILNK